MRRITSLVFTPAVMAATVAVAAGAESAQAGAVRVGRRADVPFISPYERKGGGRAMRRRTLLLLTSMASALVIASGVAMAASKIDQQQLSSNGENLIDNDEHQVQSFTAGVSRDLELAPIGE